MIRRQLVRASRLAYLVILFLALSPALLGQRPYNPTPGALGAGGAVTSVSGLTVQVAAGNVLCLGVVDNLATVNITMKARTTSYINYDCGIHAVVVDANPPTSPVQYQMAKIVTTASAVTITDARDPSVFIPTGSIGGGVHSVTTPLGSGLIISAGPDPIVTLDPAIVQTGPLTGDVTTSGVVATLASVGTAGAYGDASHSVTVTFDPKGRETAASSSAIAIAETQISFTDIATNNVSTTKHGFTPKLPNDATKYLDGTGAYTVPPGTSTGVQSPGITEVVSQRASGNCAACASKAVAYPGNTTAGDLLVVAAGGLWVNTSTITISDGVNTWTRDDAVGTSSNAGFRFYHAVAVGGASTVTVSGFPSGQANEIVIVSVGELTGNATTSVLTQSSATGSGGGNCVGGCGLDVTTPSITTTNANDFILSVISYDNRTGNVGVSSPLPTDIFASGPAYGILWTSGVTRPAGTWNNRYIFNAGSNSDAVTVGTFAFKSATGSGCLLGTSCNPVSGFYSSTGTSMTVATPDLTMVTVGSSSQLYTFKGQVNCDTTSAAATATGTLKYTDTGSTAQTVTFTDTCTALVTTGVPNLVSSFRAKTGTAITFGVSIVNTPTYDFEARLIDETR